MQAQVQMSECLFALKVTVGTSTLITLYLFFYPPVRLVNNCGCAFVRYSEEMIPLHPCLQLISNCEQTLSSHTSRRLITMEKIKEPEVCAFTFSFYSVNDGTLNAV